MECNDSIKDKMPANPSEMEVAKFTTEFERCAIKVRMEFTLRSLFSVKNFFDFQCVDGSMSSLPNLFKSIKAVLSKGPQSIPDV